MSGMGTALGWARAAVSAARLRPRCRRRLDGEGPVRDPAKAAANGAPGIAWVAGDALKADDVARRAGASVIVHAVNPPGYRN